MIDLSFFMHYDDCMRESDADIEKYKEWLKDCFNLDKAFTLEIGESCRINDDYVEHLPKNGKVNGFAFNDARFKLMYKRIDENTYQWLDSEGTQGVDQGPLEFYVRHWEKI